MRIAVFLISCLLASGCVQQHSADTPPPASDTIKFIGQSEILLSNGQRVSVLNYQTDLAIDDVAKLTLEADRIWPYFRPQVDARGFSSAMIKAHSPPKGFVFTVTKSHSFVYLKDAKGNWSRSNN